jgi:hypothetical protein
MVIAQQRTAAKAAIKRAPNELVRLVERKQARPQVNVIKNFGNNIAVDPNDL